MKLVFLFLVFVGTLVAAEESRTEQKSHGVSWAPALAYNSTFGLLFGISYFRRPYYKPGSDLTTSVAFTTKATGALITQYRYLTAGPWQYDLNFRVSNFFTPYFGEGDQTNLDSRVNIKNWNMSILTGPEYFWTEALSTGFPLDYRMRNEPDSHYFPNESSLAIAPYIRYNTHILEGAAFFTQRHQFTVRVLPSAMTTVAGADTLLQTELDLRFFLRVAKQTVFATRAWAARSFGEPTFLYRYSLGGNNILRGHLANRFRGKHAVALQEEFRFPVYGLVSGAVFGDLADVSENDNFEHWKATYGPGLRIALPPDGVAKMRLDVGFAYDQVGVAFLFGDTF